MLRQRHYLMITPYAGRYADAAVDADDDYYFLRRHRYFRRQPLATPPFDCFSLIFFAIIIRLLR